MKWGLLATGIVVIAILVTAGCVQTAIKPNKSIQAGATELSLTTVTNGSRAPEPAVTPGQSQGPEQANGNSSSRTDISGKGIWVRVGSQGAYTGTIGSRAQVLEVNGTGYNFYQVPAAGNDIVDIYIQNLDASGHVLSVEVFNNGEMIERKTIMTPMGTIVMAVDLKTAQMPTATEAVPESTPVEEESPLPVATVPVVPLPHVTSLKFKPGARYSECSMSLSVPDIVSDPDYGLNGPFDSQLIGFSEGQYAKMTRESKEKSGAFDPCYRVNLPPYWTWLEFTATLNQISSRPITYKITLYANSKNLRIPVVSSVETLNPGQDYPYKASIPIKIDQADNIISMELGIEPVSNNEMG